MYAVCRIGLSCRVNTDCVPSTQLHERVLLAVIAVIMDHETTVANAISMCSQPLIGRILHQPF